MAIYFVFVIWVRVYTSSFDDAIYEIKYYSNTLQAIKMNLPARPNVTVSNGQTVYHSLDATDQAVFDGLTSATNRRYFCEMIYRWRGAIQANSM